MATYFELGKFNGFMVNPAFCSHLSLVLSVLEIFDGNSFLTIKVDKILGPRKDVVYPSLSCPLINSSFYSIKGTIFQSIFRYLQASITMIKKIKTWIDLHEQNKHKS